MRPGIVVASFGRHVLVETPDARCVTCHPRGKKNQALVGDHVLWLPTGDEGTIERIEERRNLFYRQDAMRTKSFAANLDQVLILLAAQPVFSETQLACALIAAHAQGIEPLIALNKSDLSESFARAWSRLGPYQDMGYTLLPLAIQPQLPEPVGMSALMEHLRHKKTLLLGLSGVGKSSLINAAVPQANVQTATLSQALKTGKHTTTRTALYWVDAEHSTALIDTPGFQEFGLQHIKPVDLACYMPDIAACAQNCKFHNCSHLHEPGCGVISVVQSSDMPGKISNDRYRLYSDLFAQLSQSGYERP